MRGERKLQPTCDARVTKNKNIKTKTKKKIGLPFYNNC